MLQERDIKLNKTVSTKALMTASPVFKDGVAYVLKESERRRVVYEFVKRGRGWLCVGLGRPDHPICRGLFPAVAS